MEQRLKMELSKLKEVLNTEITSSISLEDMKVFCQQFSILVASGIPIHESLDLLAEGKKKPVKKMIYRIKEDVELGRPLSRSLANEKFNSSSLLAAMVEAGSLSGSLDRGLAMMADYYKMKDKARKKIKGELIYPLIVALVSIAVVIFTMIYIMPTYASIFQTREVDLPKLTLAFLSLSKFLRDYGLILLLGIILILVLLTVSYKKIGGFKHKIDKVQRKIPLVKNISLTSLYLYSSYAMAILAGAKTPILEIISVLEFSTNNLYYKEKFIEIEDSLEKGDELYKAFDKTGIFSDVFVTMVKTGENTGRLSELMEASGIFYSEKLKDLLETTAKLIGPMIILFMSIVVGFIVFSITIPMFDMVNII